MEMRRHFRPVIAVVAAFMFVAVILATAGSAAAGEIHPVEEAERNPVAASDEIVAPADPSRLPPGWCYSDLVGTYECKFKTPDWFPFDESAECADGFVLDAATGKCINDQLSVPEPVPAGADGADRFEVINLSLHPNHCPVGWVEAKSPLNEDLGCINNTIAPVPCPEGFVQTEFGCLDIEPEGDIVSGGSPKIVPVGGAAALDLTGEPCPEGSAIHPAYVEDGCIPYGAGPWAT